MEISFDDFCSWVVQREHMSVGMPGSWFHSPLARYLSERLGCTVGVEDRRYGPASVEPSQWQWLPLWAQVCNRWFESHTFVEITGCQAFLGLAQLELHSCYAGQLRYIDR